MIALAPPTYSSDTSSPYLAKRPSSAAIQSGSEEAASGVYGTVSFTGSLVGMAATVDGALVAATPPVDAPGAAVGAALPQAPSAASRAIASNAVADDRVRCCHPRCLTTHSHAHVPGEASLWRPWAGVKESKQPPRRRTSTAP